MRFKEERACRSAAFASGCGLGSARLPHACPSFGPLVKTPKNRIAIEQQYRTMPDALRHRYLEIERGIPASVLGSDRFAGRVRVDHRGNAVFGHWDDRGLSGFEKRNSGFQGILNRWNQRAVAEQSTSRR